MRRRILLTILSVSAFLSSLACASTLAGSDELPVWTPDPACDRSAIPDVYKWDLSRLFPNKEAWEKSRAALDARIPELIAFKGKLADPRALRDCLDLYFELHNAINRVTLYAALLLDSEQTSAEYQNMSQRGLAVMDELMRESAFIRGELLAIPDQALEKGYAAEDGPQAHRGYIDGLRRRKGCILDEDGERALAQMGDNLWAEIDLNEIPSTVESAFVAMLSDIPWPMVHDADGKEVPLGMSAMASLRRSPDRKVRKEAMEAFFATLHQYRHVFAATLGGQAIFDVNLARSRRYDTALEAYLDKDELDTAVYLNLIETVNANLEPLHRYVSLRKKALGLDEVHIYDLYIPILEDVDTNVPFPEARQTILEALVPLGDQYLADLGEGLDPNNGWIDLYPSSDKQSGAYCASVYDRTPYVKMNYQDSVNDMSTLAHEFGHAMHNLYSARGQSYGDYRYAPFLAEVASNVNEVLLIDHMLGKVTDDRVRAMILTNRLEGMKGSIYRQTQFAEFELALHRFVEEGTPVTADLLEETYLDLIRRYYGPDFTIGEHDGMEWAYIPHFYWKYYVFTYATGKSSAIALAELIRKSPENRDAYLGFLKAGCSAPPLEILRKAGVDLTQPEPIEAALRLFDETVTELEALLPTLK